MKKWGQIKIRPESRVAWRRSCPAIAVAAVLMASVGGHSNDDVTPPNLAFLEFLGMSSELDQLGVSLEETPTPENQPPDSTTDSE